MANPRFFLFTLFWVALLTDCVLILKNQNEYRLYTKTLLAPLILLAIYLEANDSKHQRSKALANLAFFFCFIGDFLLLNDSETNSFIFGLSSFLIAHILFIVFFYRLKKFSSRHRIFIFTISICTILYTACLLYFIWPGISIQNFEIPVVLYAAILGFMLVCAFNTLKNRTLKRVALSCFIPGAIFFIISDSILAISKFYISFPHSNIAVIITYGMSLFFLASGIIRFLKK